MARVRRASRQDIPALTALCRAAVGPDDYVLLYLREMVAAREIVVAEARGRIVAMLGVAPCLDRALWLGQARTHPDFRRQGFARLLAEAAYARAKRERRPALRLWTSVRNVAARRLAAATGFRRVGVFSRRVARARRGQSGLSPSRRAEDALRLWRESPVRRGGGYLAYRWHFLPLRPETLRTMARRGELLAGPGTALVLWAEDDGHTAWVSLLGGGGEAFTAARRAAGERGYAAVETFQPRDPGILRRARRAGFRPGSWGRRAVLYERRV